jgi:hypothetical protein
MIDANANPVQWAFLMEELNEAHEHLGKMISEMRAHSDYGESRLRVDMGHIMAHLNRAWTRRNFTRDLTDEEWAALREYPQDFRPIA